MPYVNECWLQLGSKVALVLALRITQLSHVYFEKIFQGGVFLIWFIRKHFRLKVNISRSADEITQESRQQPRSQVLSPTLWADSTCGIWSWCYIFLGFLKFRNQSVLLLISPLIYHFHFDHCLVSGRVYCTVQHKSDLPHTHTTDIPLPSPHSCV